MKRDSKGWRFRSSRQLLPSLLRPVREGLAAESRRLRREFSSLAGRRVSAAETEAIVAAAFEEWQTRFAEALDRRHDSADLARHNLAVDGAYLLSGDRFAFTPASGGRLVFNVNNRTDRTAAISIMVCLFLLEMVGLIFTLVGLALPVPPAGGIADDVGRLLENSRFRRLLKRVLDAVTNPNLSYAQKLEAILDLAKSIYEAGLLGMIVKKAFDDLPWWRIALLAALFLAQIIALFVPGAAAALAAKKAATIGQGIASLAGKAWELGDILEKA